MIDTLSLNDVNFRVVAASGVAAQLIKTGQTEHSPFDVPINLHQDAKCCFEPDLEFAKLLSDVRLIIWDEIVMMHVHAIEAVDNSLRHLSKVNQPFGGEIVVFLGNLRQIMPVVSLLLFRDNLTRVHKLNKNKINIVQTKKETSLHM